MLLPAVKVKLLGTAAFGFDGALLVPEAPVNRIPWPAELMVLNGRLNTTVLAELATFTT
jgi:hypothetical protein